MLILEQQNRALCGCPGHRAVLAACSCCGQVLVWIFICVITDHQRLDGCLLLQVEEHLCVTARG